MEPLCLLNFYHHGLWVPSQWILQQTGKFRVPVRHMCALAIHQGRDDVTQRGQWKIDLCSFFQTLTCGSSLALSLWALNTNSECQMWPKSEHLISSEIFDFPGYIQQDQPSEAFPCAWPGFHPRPSHCIQWWWWRLRENGSCVHSCWWHQQNLIKKMA